MVKRAFSGALEDKIFMLFVYIVLLVLFAVIAIPILHIVSSSFSDPYFVLRGLVSFYPRGISFEGYSKIFSDESYVLGLMNSVLYTVAGTCVQVTMTVLCAYPLSRRSFYGKTVFTWVVVLTMFFSGGLIPTYLVVKSLGLLDTRFAMIIPGAMAGFQVLVARSFFQSAIPEDLVEAAELDGASQIAILGVIYAVGNWNGFFEAMIYLNSTYLFPLQIILRNILIVNRPLAGYDAETMQQMQRLTALLKYALIVVSSVPILLFYPLIQKYFAKGLTVGSLKG